MRIRRRWQTRPSLKPNDVLSATIQNTIQINLLATPKKSEYGSGKNIKDYLEEKLVR